MLIAKVDAEAHNSKATAEAQGVTSYPTIKFFPKGSKEAVAYEGGRGEADFVSYMNEKAGTHRLVGGSLDVVAGTIDALDEIVAKFTGGATLSEVAAEARISAEAFKEKAEAKYADYYVRVFDKIEKSEGYVAKELARLQGILKKGGLAPKKVDEITLKTNVLKRFANKATGKDEL